MTKLTNEADFRIYVHPERWEYEAPEAEFFDGIYSVALNSHVRLSFVPDVSEICPPWSRDVLPDEHISSERDARLVQILTTRYSVTPNARLAGTDEVIQLASGNPPPGLDPVGAELSGPRYGTVWYVAPDDWQPLMDELEHLMEEAYSDVHSVRFSQIAETRLARFLEERFLPSGKLSAMHLEVLRRA
jgi:hypothetical protein